MLSFLLITVLLHVTPARAFLDNCPVNRTQWIDSSVVVDVLQNFYQDLTECGCIKQSSQSSDANPECEDRLRLLIELEKFNDFVNFYYGIEDGSDLQLLSIVHSYLKDRCDTMRSIRQMRTSPREYSENDHWYRDYWDQIEDLRVDKESADATLCEFAQKLQVLGFSEDGNSTRPNQSQVAIWPLSLVFRNNRTPARGYSDIIFRVGRADWNFSWQLGNTVANLIERDTAKAQRNLDAMFRQRRSQWKENFLQWFRIEINLRASDKCNESNLYNLSEDIRAIVYEWRETHAGIQLGRMYDQQAKVLVRFLSCFNQLKNLSWLKDQSLESSERGKALNKSAHPRGTTSQRPLGGGSERR